MKIFLDFTQGGGLCQVLASAFKFKVDQAWYVILNNNLVPVYWLIEAMCI